MTVLFLVGLALVILFIVWAVEYADDAEFAPDKDGAVTEEPALDKAREKARKKALGRVAIHRTAAHEAGHALVASRCSHVRSIDVVRIDSDWSGVCRATFTQMPGLFEAQILSCRLVYGLGGAAGEVEAVGAFKSVGAEADFMSAVEDAKKLVALGERFSFTPTRRRDVPIHRIFVKPQPPEVIDIIRDAYDVARDIVERHRAAHGKLTGALLHRREVGESELQMIFGERSIGHKFARLGPPRFL